MHTLGYQGVLTHHPAAQIIGCSDLKQGIRQGVLENLPHSNENQQE